MPYLTPDRTYDLNGVTVHEKIIPDGTVLQLAIAICGELFYHSYTIINLKKSFTGLFLFFIFLIHILK